MAKSQQVKFEVGQLVEFNNRMGRVSKIAKNGAIYVIVLGETTVLNETREELRVKKADLQLVNDILERTGDAVSVDEYVRHVIRNNISCDVSSNAKLAENGAYELDPDYIPSPGCLAYCAWEGSKAAQRVMHNLGIDLVKRANLYTGKKAEAGEEAAQTAPKGWDKIEAGEEAAQPIEDTIQFMGEAIQSIEDTIQSIEEAAQQAAVVQESIEPIEEPIQSVALADAAYALRELTFSVTRHSILTAFIDMALNKDIPGYNYQVAGNIKNLMAAAFDPVHDASGHARINAWMQAALALLVKNKERVAKMLNQPIEAAPIKMDRVSKLGMWIDNMMNREGPQGNDMTSAYDSCYVYDPIGKKLEACTFVVVEVIQSGDQGEASVIPLPAFGKESTPFQEYLTAQSAIQMRQQCIDCYRPTEPDLHIYCGIVPVLKTGRSMQAAVEDVLASAIGSIGSLKGIK